MIGFFLIIGKQGSGKTLLMTKFVSDYVKDHPNDYKIFSNYSLFGPRYIPTTLDNETEKRKCNRNKLDILKTLDENPNYFDNSIMLLDEIHLYLDSLDFMRKNNRRLQTFFSQLRKRHILLIATTQYLMNVDVRIRRQCMNVFSMMSKGKGIFEVITHEIDGYFSSEISNYTINLKSYYNSYDTNEIIS